MCMKKYLVLAYFGSGDSRYTEVIAKDPIAAYQIWKTKNADKEFVRLEDMNGVVHLRREDTDHIDHIEKQARLPFHKKMNSLDGALTYARLALETYCNAKATIEPIDEPIWKFLITVSCVEEPKKEEELPPWAANETIDPVELAQIELQCAVKYDDAQGIAEATANLATAKMAKLLVAEKKPYKGDIDEAN